MTAALGFTSLRERGLRNVVLAQLTSATGDFMALAALPAAVAAAGGSPRKFGLVLGCQGLVVVALLLVGGVVGDRFPRRSVLIGADLVRFVSQGLTAVLLIHGDASLWHLLVVQSFSASGTALFLPAMGGFLPEVVAEDHLQQANSLRRMATAVGGSAGPIICAAALASGNPGWAFAIDAITFLVSALLLLKIKIFHSVQVPPFSLIAGLIEGWREFHGRTWFWSVVLTFALLNLFVFAPFFVIAPAVAAESLGGSNAWTWLLGALGIGEVAGCIIAASWKPSRPLFAALLGLSVWIFPLVLLAALVPVGFVVAGIGVAGASVALFDATWETTMQKRIPATFLSRLGAYDQMGSFGFVPVGYLLGGLIVGWGSMEAGLIGATAVVAVAIPMVVALPSVREFRWVDGDGNPPPPSSSASDPRPKVGMA